VERATVAGGTVTHAVTTTGDVELHARLPWR
jgi:hypothetical protein